VEALVRWHHPELGVLLPDKFVSLAEETGLIVQLGRWVLTEACTQASRWNQEFPDAGLVLSVNLAARQAVDESIVDDVARVLRQTGLPPQLLQLELTESAVMDAGGKPLPSLRRLAALGIRIAIDDFGTGYSNLAYLRTLPIQSLKLAGPFVAGLRDHPPANPVDEEILDALVRLGHALGLTVTAEAVETGHQASVLQRLRCDNAQGWYYAAAAPAARLVQMLTDQARLGWAPAGPPVDNHPAAGPAPITTAPAGPAPITTAPAGPAPITTAPAGPAPNASPASRAGAPERSPAVAGPVERPAVS
jgi:EAL domain-containing protein (putative c-di-GMP-specific phosphodiesterase class I)